MILLAAVALALVVVPVTGGRLSALASLPIQRAWLVYVSLGIQLLITTGPITVSDSVGRVLHLLSYALSALFVVANRSLPGVWIVAFGGALNLAAIVANRGTMPASAWAWRTAGFGNVSDRFVNSDVVASPRVSWLGDIFAVPKRFPLANVFSIGDVVIGVGAAYLITRWCRRGVHRDQAGSAPDRPPPGR